MPIRFVDKIGFPGSTRGLVRAFFRPLRVKMGSFGKNRIFRSPPIGKLPLVNKPNKHGWKDLPRSALGPMDRLWRVGNEAPPGATRPRSTSAIERVESHMNHLSSMLAQVKSGLRRLFIAPALRSRPSLLAMVFPSSRQKPASDTPATPFMRFISASRLRMLPTSARSCPIRLPEIRILPQPLQSPTDR